jgi:hypothetical protein
MADLLRKIYLPSSQTTKTSLKSEFIVADLPQKLGDWLKSVGLQFNPFDSKYLDAGADSQLPAYLVGHNSFAAIWQDQASFVFAPTGGGKTAFRVRLARACRVGQDGRRIFPIVYKIPSQSQLGTPRPILEQHLQFINQAAALELLLTLAYQPARYFDLPAKTRRSVRSLLALNLAETLPTLLAQLADKGNLRPLVDLFDPTAERLLTPPEPRQIRELCASLSQALVEKPARLKYSAPGRFEELLDLLQGVFNYQAIYILIDGVDGYIEAMLKPQVSLELLKPLLNETTPWANRQIYTKYFLPTEFASLITAQDLLFPGEATNPKLVDINWTRAMLLELLEGRLRVASQGLFGSLDAISSPALHGLIQEELITTARALLPREVLVLAERLLLEHVRRSEQPGLLEPGDLEATKSWYEQIVRD